MKKILFVCLCTFLLSSCKTVTGSFDIYTEKTTFLDFSKYLKDGFYIHTLTNMNFVYDNVGVVNVSIREGLVRVDGKPINRSYEEGTAEHKEFVASTKERKTASVYDALDILVKECQKRGANGVIGLNYKLVPGGCDIYAIAIKK